MHITWWARPDKCSSHLSSRKLLFATDRDRKPHVIKMQPWSTENILEERAESLLEPYLKGVCREIFSHHNVRSVGKSFK